MGQVIFSEDMGNPSSNPTAISSNNFQNGSPVSFSGTADVRPTTQSSGYTGASANGNIFITNTSGIFFQISGINTSGGSNFSLSFGISKSSTSGSGSDLILESSIDGSNFTPLTYSSLPTGGGTVAWYLRSVASIPSTSNLRIRFRQTGNTTQYRIDDLVITQYSTIVPLNDLCNNAQPIIPNGSCINGTTFNATDDWSGNIGCQTAIGLHPDVWYSFVATGSQAQISNTSSGAFSGNIEVVLFSGTCPNALTIIGSDCAVSPQNATFNGLTIGTTYYYTISNTSTGSGGSFKTCIINSTPTVNSGFDCTTAAVLCNGDIFDQPSSYGGFGAQEVTPTNSCWLNGGERQSKWFKFTIGISGSLRFNINPNNPEDDYDWALWDITSGCSNKGNAIGCNWEGASIYEDFDNATFPPTGWLNSSWIRSTNAGDVSAGSGAAITNANNCSLTTASISYPTGIFFDLGRTNNNAAKTLIIEISTTSQTSGFTTVATYDHSNVPSNSYNPYFVDLSAYSPFQNVYIRFTKISSSASPWRLDEIEITRLSGSTGACSNLTACIDAETGKLNNSHWENPISVIADHTYALLVDNYSSSNNGFTLKFGGTGNSCSSGNAVIGPNSDFHYSNNSCATYQFTKNYSTSNTSYLWHFGDGTTSTSISPTHTYTASGLVTVTLIVTDALGCTSTSSQTFTVTVPTLSLNASSQTTCFSSSAQVLFLPYNIVSGSPSSYSITWNSTPVNSFASVPFTTLPASPISLNIPPGALPGLYSGLLTVKNNNNCASDSVPFTIRINSLPTITLNSNNVTTCTNINSQTLSLLYSSTTFSPTYYSIVWNSSPLNNLLTVSNATLPSSPVPINIPAGQTQGIFTGNISLTNDEGCQSSLTSFTVTLITTSIGGTAAATTSVVCSGSGTTITLSGNTGTIQWQQSSDGSTGWANVIGGSGATTSTYTTPNLTSTTYYRAVVTNGVCASANSSTAAVTVNSIPIIPVQTATICSGQTFTVSPINGFPTTSTVVPFGTTYTWTVASNINVTGQSAQISQSVVSQTLLNISNVPQTVLYTVTPFAGACSGNPFSVRVKVNTTPSIGTQTLSTCSNTGFLLTPSSAGITYTWNVTPNSTVLGESDQPIQQLFIADTITNNSGSPQIVVYNVIAENANFCTASFILNATINPLPVVAFSNPPAICSPSSINLTTLPEVLSGTIAGLSFGYYSDALATTALTSAQYNGINTSGIYYIKTINSFLCNSISPVTVTVNSNPVINITDSIAVCSPVSTYNIADMTLFVGSSPALTYNYYTDSPTVSTYTTFNNADTGIYFIKGTSTQGCSTIKKLTIWLKSIPPIPSVVSPVYLCQYDNGVAPLTAIGLLSLRWFTLPVGGLSSTIIPVPSTMSVGNFNYYVEQIDTPCRSPRAIITVKVNQKPNLGPDKDLKFCFGTRVDLDTLFTLGNLMFGWYLTNGDPVDNPNAITQSGLYEVYVSDSANCQDDAKVNIVFLPKVMADASDAGVAFLNTPHQLYGSGSGTQFLWTPSSFLDFSTIQNPLATLTADTKFYLTVTDNYGCKGYDTLLVKVLNVPGLYIPKAFTPNGDGLNDIFKPVPIGVAKFNYFKVFDRFGQIVFETTSLGVGWDGTYKGKKQNVDTYVYIISGEFKNNETEIIKGNVILIR